MNASIKLKVIGGSVVIIAVLALMLVWNRQARGPWSTGGESGSPGERDPLIFYCAAGIKPPVENVVKEKL